MLKTFLSGIVGVLIAIIAVSFFRDGEIDWATIGSIIILIFLILLIRLGLSLYKN
ncbi:hypothetical protein [Ureibacillus chungkukjangi]|uniref:Uncharacterized protein n=1 Tax=Ureibacillus chungkukjangi TaxID=1202712 RepID=A0A318TN13_9BACL|nr:hypothetical protein [Ureibacillus chungkukjangi]PYF06252.1 hypothetical protein BJ095_11183 [Ureibacillus chungkukjangi]